MADKNTHFPSLAEREARERGNNYRRLSAQLDTTVHFQELGGDPVVVAIANTLGLRQHELAILRVGHGPRIFTIIVAPARNWIRGKGELFQVKRLAAARGVKVLLMPAKWLKMPERSRNQEAISAAMLRYVNVSREGPLLDFIRTRGSATIAECKLRSRDGDLGALLSLCGRGWFRVDRSRPITAGSIVIWTGGGWLKRAATRSPDDRRPERM